MVIHGSMKMKKEVESGRLRPLIIRGLIPLCSAQYERLFSTTRIPGQEAGRSTGYGLPELPFSDYHLIDYNGQVGNYKHMNVVFMIHMRACLVV